jgi:putative tryptophan/tyrosine transport system substrate-binding protein
MKRRQFIVGLGSAAAWPVAAGAQQQPAMPVIGVLSWGPEPQGVSSASSALAAFRQGLGEQGYVVGRNVTLLFRAAEFRADRLPAMAEELANRKVAVIVTIAGLAPALAAKVATTTIPIVFELGGDPVQLGLVPSLNRPGGNITGATFLSQELVAKRLEVLHEAVPAATSIGYLVNPTSPQTAMLLREAENAARILGVRLVILNAATPSELEAAFTDLEAQRITALSVDTDNFFSLRGAEIAAAAIRHGVPAVFGFRPIVEAGGLMSYGSDATDAFRVAGIYAGRILRGEKPADLPVQRSTKVELVINLKTAKTLGLAFPLTLLGRADAVIQ